MGPRLIQRLDDLTPTEIDRLLRIMGAAQGFLRHDISGESALVELFFRLLQRFFDGKMTAHELLELKDDFFTTQSRLRNLLGFIDVHLVDRSVLWSLISYLPSIAKSVATSLEERGVTVLPRQGPAANVAFPENALHSIMLELGRNAAVHAPGSKVALEWSLQSETLIVSVHDSGKAIDHLLTDRFLALELADPDIFKPRGGLSIIRRIVSCSEGLLLVRRSKILEGAEFSVRLPISSYFAETDK